MVRATRNINAARLQARCKNTSKGVCTNLSSPPRHTSSIVNRRTSSFHTTDGSVLLVLPVVRIMTKSMLLAAAALMLGIASHQAPLVDAFVPSMQWRVLSPSHYAEASSDADGNAGAADDEAARLRARADELRDQIRKMEGDLGDKRGRDYMAPVPAPAAVAEPEGMSLRNKRVLVVGANGRLGSMVTRHLLRNNPRTEVVAAVHVVGENSPTARGYGRLAYEIGAEDGAGSIGPAWSAEDRVASFEYTSDMESYNLQNCRVVEVELLDPVQCNTITEDVDAVVWCATDFNGNTPRAVSGLNIAFLFRAVADPTKGRVEIEGLRNILGGLKNAKQSKRWNKDLASSDAGDGASQSLDGPNDPMSFVLVSAAEDAFGEFETPYGEFNAIKREGEDIVAKEFPSLSHCVLQMAKYEDNFVEEGQECLREENKEMEGIDSANRMRRRINRRDAARAVSEALTDETLRNKVVECWTQVR